MGGSTIHLQRYTRPIINSYTKKVHHLFDFVIEHPLSISNIEIRSHPFKLDGHIWYIYMSKSGNDFLSCHLRAANLTKDLNIQLNYSFTVLHPSNNDKDHFCVKGPEQGRVFSRSLNTLSWGWKHFLPITSLSTGDAFSSSEKSDAASNHTNGQSTQGFVYDGYKIMLQIEIYNIETWSNQSIIIPEISKEHSHPSISAHPVSYAGFAWQIRAFPNGYDDVSSGRLILQLFCTTSRHQCKCKIRFRVSKKVSSPVFEHIFPNKSISSLPNVIVLPTATKHIISSEVNIGIDFLEVTEINEVQIKLADPQTYPAITASDFRDMEGCLWVMKSLQGSDLKVKLDINSSYRENMPSAQNYTRHLLWNLYLVPVGLEKDLKNAGITEPDEISSRKMEMLQKINSNLSGSKSFERSPELRGVF